MRLPGRGLPRLGGARGDELAQISVWVPTRLSNEERPRSSSSPIRRTSSAQEREGVLVQARKRLRPGAHPQYPNRNRLALALQFQHSPLQVLQMRSAGGVRGLADQRLAGRGERCRRAVTLTLSPRAVMSETEPSAPLTVPTNARPRVHADPHGQPRTGRVA